MYGWIHDSFQGQGHGWEGVFYRRHLERSAYAREVDVPGCLWYGQANKVRCLVRGVSDRQGATEISTWGRNEALQAVCSNQWQRSSG